MIPCRHLSGYLGRHLIDQDTKIGFQARVFVQQVGEPVCPPLGLILLCLLEFNARH